MNQVRKPPFTLQFCYTLEGKMMEQGAGKMFSKTAENELCEQLKYCEKQSLMQ